MDPEPPVRLVSGNFRAETLKDSTGPVETVACDDRAGIDRRAGRLGSRARLGPCRLREPERGRSHIDPAAANAEASGPRSRATRRVAARVEARHTALLKGQEPPEGPWAGALRVPRHATAPRCTLVTEAASDRRPIDHEPKPL